MINFKEFKLQKGTLKAVFSFEEKEELKTALSIINKEYKEAIGKDPEEEFAYKTAETILNLFPSGAYYELFQVTLEYYSQKVQNTVFPKTVLTIEVDKSKI